ncbi:ferredoxin--NADP reductase [Vibrio sinensis]|uniref:ferredoxin--NADP(+) reductase n=1 Tax=Vibrio sinensis TaxID=2302434 RepID=A0A3A6QTL8_9VIBR|nr:ferredoxin--NADP reductase [Vibrio sinensis]RJX64850.1 ferredoxin--NADP reductase [Vibrio sinensis]
MNRNSETYPDGFVTGQVVARTDWTDNLFSLRIRVHSLSFEAGQFTKLALRNVDGEWVRRAYSLVNHPDDYKHTNEAEFLIITDSAGQLSPMLQRLVVNDEVAVSTYSSGFMTLSEIPKTATDLWLLSTGTGIGPFLSLLDESSVSLPNNNLVLVHAVRFESELVYQEKIEQFKQRYGEKFHYVPIVSRESVTGTLRGRIPMLLESGELEKVTGITLSHAESFLYLCGNPNMVKETREVLKQRGFRSNLRREAGHFSSENYW